MYFVSVTRLRLRSPRFLPQFAWHNWRTVRQTVRTPGFLDGRLLADARHTYWTLTLWEQEAAMRYLRDRGAHRQAMPKLQDWCDEAATAHWQQMDANLPSFAIAHDCLTTSAHFTRLKTPSEAHLQRIIPPPQANGGIHLKPQKSAAVLADA